MFATWPPAIGLQGLPPRDQVKEHPVNIHPTAIVSPSANLGSDVTIGPYAVIEDGAVIGAGCSIGSHTIIKTGTTLGEGNDIAEHVVLGGAPQHLKKSAELGGLVIGNNNTIREYSSFHRAMKPGTNTTIGDNNLFMAVSHVAHDCKVGSNIVFANNVMLAGHVQIEDRAFISGGVGIHQFCRVGSLAMIGGMTKVVQDVPPYVTLDENSQVCGLNLVGLRRAGHTTEQIAELKKAYRTIYRSGLKWTEVLAELRAAFPTGPAAAMHVFCSTGKRGFVQERRMPPNATLKIRNSDTETEATPAVTPTTASELDLKTKVG
jgi:UDP-N-acetylglucosamine acyltransferase